jgi:MarR family transcriptional regulator, organic hydroperoxide resistance regulator
MAVIMSGLPKFDSLEQQVFLELWRTYDRLKAQEDLVFDRFDISSQQYNALRLLQAVEPGSLKVSVLGQRMVTRAPDMTRMLDKLEKRGWISRVRKDENRRAVEVSITPQGQLLLNELAEPIIECHRTQLGHLSRDQLLELADLMKEARKPHEQSTAKHKVLQTTGVENDLES